MIPYARLKEQAARLQTEADQLEGEKRSLLKELKKEFGTTNLKKAKALLASKEAKLERLEAMLRKKIKRFEERYGDHL